MKRMIKYSFGALVLLAGICIALQYSTLENEVIDQGSKEFDTASVLDMLEEGTKIANAYEKKQNEINETAQIQVEEIIESDESQNTNVTVQEPVQEAKPANDAIEPIAPSPQQEQAVVTSPQVAEQVTLPSFIQPDELMRSNSYRVFELVNQHRVNAGMQPLIYDNTLNQIAILKSQDMSVYSYFDHTSPTFGTPFQMMNNYGVYYYSAGENIAVSSDADEVVELWMNSSGHRENIMNPSYTHIGIGYYGGYWTQLFIAK